MKSEALTALVGVSAPETPKYLLLNNFLADYFGARSHEKDNYTFSFYEKDKKILVCQESNPEIKADLERSFDEFLQCFMGRDQLSGIRSGKDKIWMPLSLDMLGSANVNLRHLLYYLALGDGESSERGQIREELYHYLYGDSTGIYGIVSRFCGIKKERQNKEKDPGGFENLREEPFFKKLGKQFNQDLHFLLTHSFFREQDFYKRLDDLAILLTMYVVFFFIRRVMPEAHGMPVLLCKGSTDSGLNEGGLHRACTSNYQSFRDCFSDLLSDFYTKRVMDQEKVLEKVIAVSNREGSIHVGELLLKEYLNKVFDANYRNDERLNSKAEDVFHLKAGETNQLSPEEFVDYYMQLTGKDRKSVV